MDFEVVKKEAQEFDRWVTGLVDLIPTQVYVRYPSLFTISASYDTLTTLK